MPDKLAVPRAVVRATGEPQTEFVEALDYAEGCAFAREQIEDRAHCALNFRGGIEHDLVALENKSDRQPPSVILGSNIGIVQAGGETTGRRIHINRHDDEKARCRVSRAWGQPKDFS